MNSFWEEKFHNTERSIAFLQATHAEILKGLHEEIEQLQKQCSDYAFRLSINASTAIEKDEFDQKFKSYNVEYKKKDALIVEQKKLIDERNKNIKSLQERIRTLERKLETEVETRDQLIKKLTLQVDTQSNQIASLTFQLHHNNKATTTTTINKKVYSNDLNGATALTAASSNTSSKDYTDPTNNTFQQTPLMHLSQNPYHHNTHHHHSNPSISQQKPSTPKSTKTGKGATLLLEEVSSSYFGGGGESILTSPKNNNDQNLKQTNVDIPYDEIVESSTNIARRSTRSPSNSAHSDRSLTPPPHNHQQVHNMMKANKILPPVIKFKNSSIESKIIESMSMDPHLNPTLHHHHHHHQPKPFLQSAASVLHPKSKKDILQTHRRTLISLPPIKPFELNQLAVESPLKGTHINSTSLSNLQTNKNNANN